MPYHSSDKPKTTRKEKPKEKPLNKPRKDLTKLQKEFMKEHKKKHSKAHNEEMIKLMKQGYCIQQAHKIAMKTKGK